MVRRNFGGLSAGRARGGFTLVELLVVIIIIAILAAIAVPAVMRATATAQNARIKTEIDMLHMAIQQYKNEYGSYPPAVDVDTAGNPVATNFGNFLSCCCSHDTSTSLKVLIAYSRSFNSRCIRSISSQISASS